MVNNYDWFKDMSFSHLYPGCWGIYYSNYMSAKDSVRKRLDGENGNEFYGIYLSARPGI